MTAGGMAVDQNALTGALPEEQAGVPHLLDDVRDRHCRAQVVTRHRDADAAGIEAARHLAELRGFQRFPVAAVNEQCERRLFLCGRPEQIEELPGGGRVRRGRVRRAAPPWRAGDILPRPAPSRRRSPDGPERAPGCCTPPRSRSLPSSAPVCAKLGPRRCRGQVRFALAPNCGYDTAMKVDGRHTRSIWLEPDGWSVGVIDQTALPHRFVTLRLTTLDRGRARDSRHADPWRAADRRDGGLRHLSGRAGRPVGRGAGARLCGAAARRGRRRSTCTGRSTKCGRRCATGRPTTGSRRPIGGPRRSPTRTSPSTGRSAGTGVTLIEAIAAAQETGRAGQHPHPLQRRLAGDRRCRHRDRADLRGARPRHPGPRLGGRDPPAQSGRVADRVGTGPARRAAHRHRRQRRRPPDAARHGRSW